MHGFSRLYLLAFGVAIFAGIMLVFSLLTGNVPGRRGASSNKKDNPQLYWRSIIGLAIVAAVGLLLGLWGLHAGRG